MRKFISDQGFVLACSVAALALVFCELTFVGWFTVGRAAQESAGAGAQKAPDQPGKNKPIGRQPKEEEEETIRPPRKVPPRVGDEDLEATQASSGSKPGPLPSADLEREAKRARHPAVQELFRSLARPHDLVTLTNKRSWKVEPIPEYMGPTVPLPPALSLHRVDTAWKRIESVTLSSNEIFKVEPYEQLALNQVELFLTSGLDRDPKNKQYLPRLEMVQEAEKALRAVLLFHDSATERGLRKGPAWNKLRGQLAARLREVQLDQLRALTDQRNWEAAFELATRLSEAYPAPKDQDEIVALLARFPREALKEQNYDLTSRRLLGIEAQFPNSRLLDPIRAKLRRQAAALLQEARARENANDLKGALASLERARQMDPQLPGLQDFFLRLSKKNPALYVGVHDLPEYLSPATATLDSEKQAVELLFESLVKFTSSSKLGPRYQPVLASDLPRMVPLGRQFTLTPGAYWSNGMRVTAADVRHTVELLSRWPGQSPEWVELLKGGARIEGDSFHITLTLHQGYRDPLSLMDFKILPQWLKAADDPDFAKAPVGSGPYQWHKRDAEEVVFVANPFYEARAGKSGLPLIREIHFVHSENPVSDFQEGRLQLLLDLPTSRYKQLDSAGLTGVVDFLTMPNRRIYFLAVNHRHPSLDNKELRRALAHAINRQAILNDCFREGLTSRPHRPLNGPYPPGSWAWNPTLPADPYDPNLARAQAAKAQAERTVPLRLTLKYPKGDPAVAKACLKIQDQVQQLAAGISLELQALEPQALRRDVEDKHDYDLAYYWWDYPDETYWLWPLFDPRAMEPGGRNFLGCHKDVDLQSLIIKTMSYRDPARIKSLTHRIHELFFQNMPFIPLWQLDTHVAVHRSLALVDGQGRPVDIDPLLIFTGVETWTLQKR